MQNKDPSWKDGPLGIAGKVLALDTTTAVVSGAPETEFLLVQ